MTAVFAFAGTGIAVGWLVRVALLPLLVRPALARQNYRGRTVATAGGLVVVCAAFLVEAARVVLSTFDVGRQSSNARIMVVFAAAAFGFLGLADDIVGSGHAQGFRGHVRELGRGRLTTGGLKLVGGAGAALAIVGVADPNAYARQLGAESAFVSHLPISHLLVDAALVALAANLANQLDRRPGRVGKAGVVAFVALVLATGGPRALDGVAVVVGATAALLIDDLRERLMLGDVGANALGACLGVGVVVACSFGTRVAVLAVVVVLNLIGELTSFTRIIDAVPPLRALDRAGRRDP